MKKFLLFAFMVMVMATGAVFAQSYDIKVMTPQVKSALEGRKARFSELKSLKGQCLVGETNRGYVQALGGGGDVKSLVKAENADRKEVYQAIVEQNDLGAAALSTVEAVFAGVQRDKASSGEKVQDADGNWMTK